MHLVYLGNQAHEKLSYSKETRFLLSIRQLTFVDFVSLYFFIGFLVREEKESTLEEKYCVN